MRRYSLLLLILVATANLAVAQSPEIGIYADSEGTIDFADIDEYVGLDIYVLARLYTFPSMTAAEFRIDDYVGDLDPACAIVSATWNTPLIIGEPGWGIALAFSPPLPGPIALLGTINIFLLDAACLGEEYVMWIRESNDSGKLVVVDDQFNEHDADGSMFTLYTDLVTATEQRSWSSLRALY